MTPLREKMIREMDLKNLSPHTQRSYLQAVTGLAKHYQQSPDAITTEMIEDYLLYLKNDKDLAPESCRLRLTGLRFFYKHIVDQQISVGFSLPRKPRRLPTVLTKQQISKIICAPDNLKHRLILMTTYAAGLRASEVRNLKPDHIDSQRMLIKVVDGILPTDYFHVVFTRYEVTTSPRVIAISLKPTVRYHCFPFSA
jgi:site-specific recombinase XerD